MRRGSRASGIPSLPHEIPLHSSSRSINPTFVVPFFITSDRPLDLLSFSWLYFPTKPYRHFPVVDLHLPQICFYAFRNTQLSHGPHQGGELLASRSPFSTPPSPPSPPSPAPAATTTFALVRRFTSQRIIAPDREFRSTFSLIICPTPCPSLTNHPLQRMNQLRLEADESASKVEELQTKVKALEQENLAKEQEITSLTHKNGLLESENEKMDASIKELKKSADESQQHGTHNETLQRRLQLLEEEAEQADKTLRETNEKLRQTDVKAGHFERKVQALEQERDNWETKYEEVVKKHTTLQKELEDLQNEIGNI
ncbi:tropomyosin like-domain-containing protein [Xylaria arbuscula]|nr:tropomyosin like-domain-containing protein [Xylaria arbuscula]